MNGIAVKTTQFRGFLAGATDFWPADRTMTATMRLARATPEDLPVILGLIEEAAAWLRCSKNTSQWSKPWPNEEQRNARVLKGLLGGKTWIVWDEATPAATITVAKQANTAVWPESVYELSEPAVYVHRLITARPYAGWGLGADLIDWAGCRAAEQYRAQWIRVDVWTSNTALHEYYRKRGFEFAGFCPNPEYPSGALFEKPVSAIEERTTPPLWQPPDNAWLN